jgi:hypothetical protein
METDTDKLNRILKEIHEHAGATTLWSDLQWLLRIQTEQPAWARDIFAFWNTQSHVLDNELKNAVR